MTCERIQDMMATTYIDGRASAEERLLVDRHLETCADCKAFYQAVVQTKDVFASASREEIPFRIWEGVQERLEPKPAWWQGLLFVPRPAYAFAILSMVIVVGAVTGRTVHQGLARTQQGASLQLASSEIFYVEDEIVNDGFGSATEEAWL